MKEVNLILKVLIFSASLAAAIKYLAPSLTIPATSANALIAVLTPSTLMAVLLLWRSKAAPDDRSSSASSASK